MSAPVFAVVGRPNKGKSSIVATLARDPSVYIDSKAGSTRNTRKFPMKIDGETLYELVDTPGIQRARSVMEWLTRHETDAARRPALVAEFYEQHKDDQHFRDECLMLKPIIDGAGIIYVVDCSVPFGVDYEAEMEILRWTGQPSLAVINPIENDEFVDEWKAGLGQYFRTVRVFDAHRAEPEKQLELLELFGHLDQSWQTSLSRAVGILRADRSTSQQTVGYLIGDLIIEALTYQVEQSVPDGVPQEPVKKVLLLQYKNHLEAREKQTRRQIEEIYHHKDLDAAIERVEMEESDLFNMEDWYFWGLNKKQMVSAAATVGLVAGGGTGLAFDALHLGTLGLPGTLISGLGGALTGATGSWLFADRIGKMKIKGLPNGGKRLTYGPTTNINFPFVLLGRSILYHNLVSIRAHASQSAVDMSKQVLDALSDSERKTLAKLFADIQSGKKPKESRETLCALIIQSCKAVDG
jgi:GTPase Era involved in 16S rRNA processing